MRSLLILVIAFSLGNAHSGRTDSSGCHYDRKTGVYHCHKSSENLIEAKKLSNTTQGEIIAFESSNAIIKSTVK